MKALYLTDNELKAIESMCGVAGSQYDITHGELDYAELGEKSIDVIDSIITKIHNAHLTNDIHVQMHPVTPLSGEETVMWYQATNLQTMLVYCSVVPDADITITVEHKDGHKAFAKLYDHPALTQELDRALEYFKSEL